uniref:Uncharacterized protein n=1 Tax=Brassica campestris TaxID=3711 RepID=M4F1F3_BRACM
MDIDIDRQPPAPTDRRAPITDPDGHVKAINGRTLHVSREDIANILHTSNGADNLFMHHRSNPEHKVTKEFYDTAGGIDNSFIHKSRHPSRPSIDATVPVSVDRHHEFGRRAYDLYGHRKFDWEEKDYTDIRRLLERASRDEPSYIYLPEHANLFKQTKLLPEIYTKYEINEMFYGACGEQENNKEAFQMKLDGIYHPLNDSIGWLTTCIEEMKQDIARIQQGVEASCQTSIDRRHHASIDCRSPTSIDPRLPASIGIKEWLGVRFADIYFPMDLSITALTSKIEAMQGELVEIQKYIARRPEASASIDRRNKRSTDIHHQTSVDDATNLGRLVPKMKSDIFDTNYHGEETSADTYATLRRHQFNIESVEEMWIDDNRARQSVDIEEKETIDVNIMMSIHSEDCRTAMLRGNVPASLRTSRQAFHGRERRLRAEGNLDLTLYKLKYSKDEKDGNWTKWTSSSASSMKLGLVHSSSVPTKSAPLAGLLAHSAEAAESQLISARRTVRALGRWSGSGSVAGCEVRPGGLGRGLGLLPTPNPIRKGEGMQVAERGQPLADGAHSLASRACSWGKTYPLVSINMGALWSNSLSNSRVKYSEKNVERKKERKREFRPRERPIVVVLCSGDSDRLRTNSGQEWEIKTRRRAWRTQTWFTRYVMGRGSIRPNGRSMRPHRGSARFLSPIRLSLSVSIRFSSLLSG